MTENCPNTITIDAFCYCRNTDDGTKMVLWNKCKEWYHASELHYIAVQLRKERSDIVVTVKRVCSLLLLLMYVSDFINLIAIK